MPKKRVVNGISGDTLKALQANGSDSIVLRARLQYADADGFLRALQELEGKDRVHPSMLPTQSSGRWSTKEPPVVNFPTDVRAKEKNLPPLRNVFIPDIDHWWLVFDWDAIEAKLAAAYAGVTRDIEAFNKGWEIHTLTACDMFSLPHPPVYTQDAIMKGPECAEWRERLSWEGKEDLRRLLSKNARYGLTYGGDPFDPYNLQRAAKALLAARGTAGAFTGSEAEKKLIAAGVAYLKSRPELVEWKKRVWEDCMRTRVSRTFLGRRRMLFAGGNSDTERKISLSLAAREGLNHTIQGAVADIMNMTLAELDRTFPDTRLAFQAHDGAKWQFPNTMDMGETLALVRPIVEKTWDIGGHQIKFTATFEAIRTDGEKVALK